MRKLFGNRIEPACEYCSFSRNVGSLKGMLLCEKKGGVSPVYRCGKFKYDPTKRIPKRSPLLPSHEKSEFEL